jgi:hypothetical protein
MQTTWAPQEMNGQFVAKSDLPESVFAFPKQRKLPMTNAKHVRDAIARFHHVTDVSEGERALAFANIKKAARHYDVELAAWLWRDPNADPRTYRNQATAEAEMKRDALQCK